jgi:sulfatase maturation enzyme AslB (radical SAM superfamily)
MAGRRADADGARFLPPIGRADRYLRPAQRAVYTIQTNGTLLDEEWTRFFREHDFLVGISIVGPRGMHDAPTTSHSTQRCGQ